MASKLPSQTYSSGSLQEGQGVLQQQQVKMEPETLEMEQELKDSKCWSCLLYRSILLFVGGPIT